LFIILSDHGMDHGLEDVLFGNNALHIFNQVVGFVGLVVLQVVDHEVESGLGDHVHEGRKHLEGVLSTSEDDEVVPQQIIILENITSVA